MANLQKLKKITAIVMSLSLIVCLAGCARAEKSVPFAARVSVQGDVENPYLFTGEEGYKSYKITDEGKEYTAVSLGDIVAAAQPNAEEHTLLLIGRDGLTSEIDGKDLSGCHIAYTDDLGWQHIAENHPISSRVKLLDKIVVVAKDYEMQGANFAGNTKKTSLTPGSVYKTGFGSEIVKSGTSEINGRYVSVYTKDITARLTDVMDFEKTVAIFTKDGRTTFDRPNENSRIIVGTNSITYIKSTDERVENIGGILADPPLLSITETYNDALSKLDKGQRVLIIEIDGWGKTIADYAKEKGVSKFLNGCEQQTLLSVYPFVSTAGLAAMVTGKTGEENGIYSRQHKELKCEDIFETVAKSGKKASYIENSIGLIKTSLPPTLSPDIDKPDDGVLKNTLTAIESDSDFIYTHFHSVDDFATTYGPYADKTMAQLDEVDRMVQQLAEKFEGTVIITADHGLHEKGEGGFHGIVSKEDSLVPYIMIEGGKND
ncbi:MAG: alkaline phosphatase family protein [Oscillospiraceae bacterium]